MDYNSQTCDPNKISKNEKDNIQNLNFDYSSLLRACEEADTNYFDVQSTAVAVKDDFSILWNEQIQHSKLMDTNLDDIEMNDELLDKLVTAILQENTLDMYIQSDSSNLPIQSQVSCNHEMQEVNSTVGVLDNTFQIWQKLVEGDYSLVGLSQSKLNFNQSSDQKSASHTPRPLVKRPSEDIFNQDLIITRSPLNRASTPQKVFPNTHFRASPHKSSSPSKSSSAKRITVSRTNSRDRETTSTNSNGVMTRSRSASLASQADAHHQLTITPDNSSRYHLRIRSSARNQSSTRSCPSKSKSTSKIPHRTPTDRNNSNPGHEYLTRSRTGSNKAKAKAPVGRCCTKLAVVVRRARISMIARLRCRRSSIRLPTPKKSQELRRLLTPKKKLEPRRLSLRKTKALGLRKSSRHAPSARRR